MYKMANSSVIFFKSPYNKQFTIYLQWYLNSLVLFKMQFWKTQCHMLHCTLQQNKLAPFFKGMLVQNSVNTIKNLHFIAVAQLKK